MLTRAILLMAAWLIAAAAAAAPGYTANELTALARIDPARSEVADFGGSLQVTLTLSQPVPWRIFTLTDPARLVLDFSEVAFDGVEPGALVASDAVSDLAAGPVRPGWSRMVVELARPMAIETAGLSTATLDGSAVLKAQLAPVDAKTMAQKSGAPRAAGFVLPSPASVPAPRQRQTGDRPLVVALDPGHGGIDPGAEGGEVSEAALMMDFAQELRAVLDADPRFDVVLTRDGDEFVPLEARVSLARAAGADVFLSLHADALAEGRAQGATVYTMSEAATDEISQKLAERHNRADLLAGVDLSRQDDAVAGVLMDLARTETQPRSDRLADTLVAGIAEATGSLHKRPRLSAGFSVLKAPDIPSVLVELGFLSSARDRERLLDPAWRARMAQGIRAALAVWGREDAAEARLLRK